VPRGDRSAPTRSRKHLALVLLACTIGALGMLRVVRQPGDLLPRELRAGAALSNQLSFLVRRAGGAEKDTLDVVFVARSCPACRALVASLAAGDRSPVAASVTFVTDVSWPELDRLRSSQVHVVEDSGANARSLGVRATPTVLVVTSDGRSVLGSGVGLQFVSERFRAPISPNP